jgi:proteasome lid subunit RPN8/RPN11
MLEISREVFSKLLEITKKNKPNEACAYLFKNNTVVVEAMAGIRSAVGFDDINPMWVESVLREYGYPSAVFHSHPCEAIPSGKDVRFMKTTIPFWGCKWLIMSNKYLLKCWNYKECCGVTEEEVRLK